MDINKLRKMGLTNSQINEIMNDHNKALNRNSQFINHPKLDEMRKRSEIMAIEDAEIRQQLIKENSELFQRKG